MWKFFKKILGLIPICPSEEQKIYAQKIAKKICPNCDTPLTITSEQRTIGGGPKYGVGYCFADFEVATCINCNKEIYCSQIPGTEGWC